MSFMIPFFYSLTILDSLILIWSCLSLNHWSLFLLALWSWSIRSIGWWHCSVLQSLRWFFLSTRSINYWKRMVLKLCGQELLGLLCLLGQLTLYNCVTFFITAGKFLCFEVYFGWYQYIHLSFLLISDFMLYLFLFSHFKPTSIITFEVSFLWPLFIFNPFWQFVIFNWCI